MYVYNIYEPLFPDNIKFQDEQLKTNGKFAFL